MANRIRGRKKLRQHHKYVANALGFSNKGFRKYVLGSGMTQSASASCLSAGKLMRTALEHNLTICLDHILGKRLESSVNSQFSDLRSEHERA